MKKAVEISKDVNGCDEGHPGKKTFSGAGKKRIKLQVGLAQRNAGTRGKEIENTTKRG